MRRLSRRSKSLVRKVKSPIKKPPENFIIPGRLALFYDGLRFNQKSKESIFVTSRV